MSGITLFLCGDVMTGRGVDQVLPRPSDPRLFEPTVESALEYVRLVVRKNGPLPIPVGPSYVWGDALEELERFGPDARIVNLETAITTSDTPWPGKPVHYRMHPENAECLVAAGIDCATLANNHTLDWGVPGLLETLDTLEAHGIAAAGAGRTLDEAAAPAVLETAGGRRVLVFGVGSSSSGIPAEWAAGPDRPGIWLPGGPGESGAAESSDPRHSGAVEEVARRVRAWRRKEDLVVVSVHWGPNWGYEVPAGQRRFARRLVDEAGVHVVHGHSSHHPKGIEVYRGCPILYGCGDFINDYEGIAGYERYRDDLSLMYLPVLSGARPTLSSLRIVPFTIRRLRLERVRERDARWLRETLAREGRRFGTGVVVEGDVEHGGALTLRWT